MDNQQIVRELFSDSTKKMIYEVSPAPVSSLEDLIKVQEATDKSHKLHSVLESWSEQKTEERKLRKLYALCFVVILGLQILVLNTVLILIGCKVLSISEVQFNVFFVSMFGEITAFVLIVTKYLFPQESDTKLIETIKDL